ncbi:synaptotagmin-like protein 4 [Dunckerocampus dactyliophorus]|uniref:synaptotagmin-like protein 4 n=1 Tax=Dunckerocampus dactyliophorus TaxID=161453 RepID=UPI0024058007|nr:synaptotagmin-like protein 4 [Dunckerocampus dactyliophorus]
MPEPADNIDLGFLSDTERDLILQVLRRDEELRKAEEQRIRKLKAELLEIKRKGAKRGSGRYSQKSCGRCQTPLSALALNNIQCQQCHHLVCSKCRASVLNGAWLCSVCAKESDLRKSTGDWFYNLRVNRFSTSPGHELVRRTLRKRPVSKKYVTMGDVLLKSEELSQAPSVPVPVHSPTPASRATTPTPAFIPLPDPVLDLVPDPDLDPFPYPVPDRVPDPVPDPVLNPVLDPVTDPVTDAVPVPVPVSVPVPVPVPVPIPRQRVQTTSSATSVQRTPSANSESATSVTSLEIKAYEDTLKLSSHSDTESAENTSLSSSKTGTESRHVTPELSRRETTPHLSSPAGSSDSSLTRQVIPDAVSIHSSSSEASTVPEIRGICPGPELDVGKLFKKSVRCVQTPPIITERLISGLDDDCDQPDSCEVQEDINSHSVQVEETQMPDIKQVSPSPVLDVEQIFKRSVRRVQNPPEHLSTLDLRDTQDTLEVPIGNRSHSVPALDMHEDEEEDIDSLVNFHRRTMASSSASSQSTHGSLMSIYSESGDHDSVEVRGEVVFSIIYNESSHSLQVFIKECHGLAYGDTLRQLSNPYVKCYLLPDKSRMSKRKTTIKRHTCDPVYKETFKYSIRRSQLLTRSMLISVWHHGRFSRNPFLGEVEIALDCFDLESSHEECMALMTRAPCCVPASAFTEFKGELVVSLKYFTPKAPVTQKSKGKKPVAVEDGELHILIKEARNLMAMKGGGGTSDSFVKGYLFPSKSKTTKRKTPVVKKNLNPHYGHTFVYKELALGQLKNMCLELTVWDREPMFSNEFLGGVRLSSGKGTIKMGNDEVEMDSVGEEVSLWQKMMQYPDSWAEGSLPLRATMRKKKTK